MMLILIGVPLLLVSFLFPFFGLITYLTILYLRPMQVYPQLAHLHIARIFAIVTLIGFFLKYGKKEKVFFNFKQDRLLVGLLIVILLSFSVGWIPRCLIFFWQMLKNIAVYMLIVGMVKTEKRFKIIIFVILVLSGILAIDAIQRAKFIDNPFSLDYGRIGGFSGAYFGDSNDFAVMINVAIPFTLILGLFGKPFYLRPLSLLLGGVFIAALVISRSRGGFITFGIIILGMVLFSLLDLPKLKHRIISLAICALVVIGIVSFSPRVFKERMKTILAYKNQNTAVTRIENWKIGIKMFLSSPIIGVGAGNYQLRYRDFGGWNPVWMVSHNMYIDVLSELGLLGFGCFFFLLYYTFKGFKEVRRRLRRSEMDKFSFLYFANFAAMLSLIAYCVGGMFLSIFVYPILYIIIALNVAIQNISMIELEASENLKRSNSQRRIKKNL